MEYIRKIVCILHILLTIVFQIQIFVKEEGTANLHLLMKILFISTNIFQGNSSYEYWSRYIVMEDMTDLVNKEQIHTCLHQ